MLGTVVVFGAMLVISRELIRIMPIGVIYTIFSVFILGILALLVGAGVGILFAFVDQKRQMPLSEHLASGIVQGILFIIITPFVVFWFRRKQRQEIASNALRLPPATFSETDNS
ncbi:hypothetical protein RNI52_08795 [Labrys neptuniae]|uniref:hypothetical protein n=1 Tax=Labrys neptuniae TaxID=376174 RepID=UPI00288F01F8|nr:hypothetical protein [Labrys neptuniae]MDT3377416.1 hypothetical protein [Labrys neptuniae]